LTHINYIPYNDTEVIPLNDADKRTIRSFFQAFSRSYVAYNQQARKRWGLSTAVQGHVLHVLYAEPGMSLMGLVDRLSMDKGFLSKQIQQLVQMNLIAREANPLDGRAISLYLTDQGRELKMQIDQSMESYMNGIMAGVPLDKQAQLVESLDWMLIGLQETLVKQMEELK